MIDRNVEDTRDIWGYREHISRLERERFLIPILALIFCAGWYFLKAPEISEAGEALLAIVGLGFWGLFNEVRASRIEALKYRAHIDRVSEKDL